MSDVRKAIDLPQHIMHPKAFKTGYDKGFEAGVQAEREKYKLIEGKDYATYERKGGGKTRIFLLADKIKSTDKDPTQ